MGQSASDRLDLSFRALLPNLGEEELQRLRTWAADNCSVSSVFREGEAVIWLASKDKARSREAFLRSARSVPSGSSALALDRWHPVRHVVTRS